MTRVIKVFDADRIRSLTVLYITAAIDKRDAG